MLPGSTARIARAVASALVLAWGAGARAQPSPESTAALVRTEIFVVLASEAEGVIDPRLSEITALRRPPFAAFRSMQVIASTEAQLAIGRPVEYVLPNGRTLRIELERTTAEGRYRVRVSINTRGQTDYLPLLQIVAAPGEPFFVAGQNWQFGTLVIGVRIGERRAGSAG